MSPNPEFPQHHPAMRVARNIVNQILDEAGTDVETRQRINDDCDQFAAQMLTEYASSDFERECAELWTANHLLRNELEVQSNARIEATNRAGRSEAAVTRVEAVCEDPDWANGHVSVVRVRAALAGPMFEAANADDEEFCSHCLAGLLSSEHHQKCVIPERQTAEGCGCATHPDRDRSPDGDPCGCYCDCVDAGRDDCEHEDDE